MYSIKKLLGLNIVRNGVWMFALQGINSIIPFLTLPYITRILTASKYGQFSIALNWISYLQVLVEYGFTYSGARKIAGLKNEQAVRKIYSAIVYARMLLCVLSIVILVSVILSTDLDYIMVKCLFILYLMVVGTVMEHTWFFQGKQDMKFIAISSIIGRIVSTLLIFIFVKKSDQILIYCFLYSVNFLIMAIAGFLIARRKHNIRLTVFKWVDVMGELKDGFYLFLSSAMTRVVSGFGITYMSLLATDYEIGVYSAINKIPVLLSMLWAPLAQVFFPYVSQRFKRSWDDGIGTVRRFSYVIIPFYSVISLLLILFRTPLIKILFGNEYQNFSLMLIPQILWVIEGIINNLIGIQVLVASGMSKYYSKIFMSSTIISVILILILGYFYKTYGISVASYMSEMILTILLLRKIYVINKNRDFVLREEGHD